MYQRHEQPSQQPQRPSQQPQANGIDNTLGKLDGIVGRVEGLAERYGRPPGERPDAVPITAPAAPSSWSRSTHIQPDQEDGFPISNVTRTQPHRPALDQPTAPQPADKPRKDSRRSQRSQQQDDFEVAVASIPVKEGYKPASTRRFLLELAASLYCMGSAAVIFSTKFLGGYAAFKFPVAIVSALLWSPPVVVALLAVGIWARHSDKRQLFEQTWQVAVVFLMVKILMLAFLGGSW